MPTYVSINGVWKPGKEKVALVNRSDKAKVINGKSIQPGEPYIYEGPDRAALYELFESKVDTFGMDFRTDPQMIEMVRKLGFGNMKEYLDFVGADPDKEAKVNEEKLVSSVSKHELPKRVEEIQVLSGGTEQGSGKEIRKGGWDNPPDL